ncbi:hypothetical protein SteCoe_23444 [Stentor coeruleus]|uniref:DOMON domain-containing protein n=1 Tax=Stentor coeruleus TaxID=5963 RepID=A0A1R2BKA6_9CILI|nr:hypothetical protein SteCoe_23444 [Stentor coeruleus]
MLALLLLKSVSVFAGQLDLNENMWLNWTAVNETSAKFILGVNSKLYSEKTWAGVGFKAGNSTTFGMKDSDIVTFILGQDSSCQDRFGQDESTFPNADAKSDIVCGTKSKEGNVYLFSWERNIETGDANDFSLKDVQDVVVLWAYGPVDNDGAIQAHGNTTADRGYVKGNMTDLKSAGAVLSFTLALALFLY